MRKAKTSKSKNKTWLLAAMLVAEGASSEDEIAQRCNISPRTLRNWKKSETFILEVQSYTSDWYARLSQYGFASKLHRVAGLDELLNRAFATIRERGADPGMKDVPGGKHGLLIRRVRVLSTTDDQGKTRKKAVAEYETDGAIVQAIPVLMTRIGEELGQLSEKQPWRGPNTGITEYDLRRLSDEELEELEQLTARAEVEKTKA